MIKTQDKMALPRRVGYVLIGIMILGMVALSIIEPLLLGSDNLPGFGSIPADSRGLPADDKRGAFLVLNQPHNPLYAGDLVELLATVEAGVVDEKAGAHLLPTEIKSVLIQTAALSENRDYRVYRFNVEETQTLKFTRDPSGKLMYITMSNGRWEPGTYIVDIPSEGMFGGRTYYQFYVDDPARMPTPTR